MSFADIVQSGLNNPDCAFFTGHFIGQYSTLRIIFYFFIMMLAYKLIDRIVIRWIVEKIWGKKHD